ncbi:hypothetical protein ES703_21425 [subsurface metagenome]
MPRQRRSSNGSISPKQMKDAIRKSGYLLEQRIEPIIAESGYYVETNPVFQDPQTGKSREIDMRALAGVGVYKKEGSFIFPTLLCECENNAQPAVFFTKESILSFTYCEDLKTSGIPVKFWEDDGYVSLAEFTKMEKFHHYCKGDIATQYCTFQLKKDKSSWIAFHSEEQHDTFSKLIKAVDYEVGEHYKGWSPPEKVDEEVINIQIYYPLLILEGGLYSAYLKNNRLVLRKSEHVQFRTQLFSSYNNEIETYQIDVITEKYLPRYLRVVEFEIERIKKALQRKRSNVFESIEKIVEEARRDKEKAPSYRKYLEF